VSEVLFFHILLYVMFALAGLAFVALFFMSAPYGRHIRRGWGPVMRSQFSWVLMEAPAALIFAFFFLIGANRFTLPSIVFLCIWEFHYLYRAFLYPWFIRKDVKSMPISVVLMGIAFNLCNGYLNGRYLFTFARPYPTAWLLDPRFIFGVALFLLGIAINRQADNTLRKLRKPGETSYQIPQGGLYKWISSPNYFGEIIQWLGWALATWSWAGLVFALWTMANLVPRAWFHHQWYRKQFPDYPPERKALVPVIW
jgi:3-oxo-5-alpha-steroid 4-dehydrogenase 1